MTLRKEIDNVIRQMKADKKLLNETIENFNKSLKSVDNTSVALLKMIDNLNNLIKTVYDDYLALSIKFNALVNRVKNVENKKWWRIW